MIARRMAILAAAFSLYGATAYGQVGPSNAASRESSARAEIESRVKLLSAPEKAELATRLDLLETRSLTTRRPVAVTTIPSLTAESLIDRLRRKELALAVDTLRTVDRRRPVYPICKSCNAVTWPACHASQMRTQYDSLVKEFYQSQTPALESAVLIEYYGAALGSGFIVGDVLVTTNHGLGEILDPDQGGLRVPTGVSLRFSLPQARTIPVPAGIRVVRQRGEDAIALRVPAAAASSWKPNFRPAAVGDGIAVVGYPISTEEETPDDVLKEIFGSCDSVPWEALTISPGTVVRDSHDAVAYNANTYRGNSGSAVIRRSDGAVIGMHRSEGTFNVSNYAVPSAVLSTLLAAATAP